ncbi:MAG: ArsR family transcriptional regulator [Anaerolineae bacterium]|jgi:predicted ArsR family transcriptional regulator
MQKTRERIVHILKVRGQSTVDELSQELGLTPVTVRHHLEILRCDGLVAPPQPLHRPGPGRPRHLYHLAEEASALFPKSYDVLAGEVLRELEENLSPPEFQRAIERVAQRIADQAEIPGDADFSVRLEVTVKFLSERGYLASLREDGKGRLLLHIANCPYERIARDRAEPCDMDAHALSLLLGCEPDRVERISAGDDHCTYVLSADEG